MTIPPPLQVRFFVDPEVVIDINGLSNPMTIMLPYIISNSEDTGYYFKVEITEPGTSWLDYEKYHGFVSANSVATGFFNPRRYHPTLTGGEYEENKKIKWYAYKDANYTELYTLGEIIIKFVFFDHGDSAFVLIDYDNFDMGTKEGWSADGTVLHDLTPRGGSNDLSTDYRLSPPYSLRVLITYAGSTYKSFSLSAYSKGYATIHVYKRLETGSKFMVALGTKCLLNPAFVELLPSSRWYRFSMKLIGGTLNTIRIGVGTEAHTYIDEVWVVAKQ